MLDCIKRLTPKEQKLIIELFFGDKSKLSAKTGIPYITVHAKKSKILEN